MKPGRNNDPQTGFLDKWKELQSADSGCPQVADLLTLARQQGNDSENPKRVHLERCESCRGTVELLRQELADQNDSLAEFLARSRLRSAKPRRDAGPYWQFLWPGPDRRLAMAYAAAVFLFVWPFAYRSYRSNTASEDNQPVQVAFSTSPPVSVQVAAREVEASAGVLRQPGVSQEQARQERDRMAEKVQLAEKTDPERFNPDRRGQLARAVVAFNQTLEQIEPPRIEPIQTEDSKNVAEIVKAFAAIQPAPGRETSESPKVLSWGAEAFSHGFAIYDNRIVLGDKIVLKQPWPKDRVSLIHALHVAAGEFAPGEKIVYTSEGPSHPDQKYGSTSGRDSVMRDSLRKGTVGEKAASVKR